MCTIGVLVCWCAGVLNIEIAEYRRSSVWEIEGISGIKSAVRRFVHAIPTYSCVLHLVSRRVY